MNPGRRPVIVGNWKMNPDHTSALALARECAGVADEAGDQVTVGVAIPYVWLSPVEEIVEGSRLQIGAQDVSPHVSGAFTGDISAGMIEPWCDFAIVGHSERRQHHGETDEEIRDKIAALHSAGMTALLCVGETASQRADGSAREVVAGQLQRATTGLTGTGQPPLQVAYEPVWAIGTGVSAEPDDVQDMASHIRAVLAQIAPVLAETTPILYGGSVTAANSQQFLNCADIDGALVGGASLKGSEFAGIVRAVREI